MRLLPNDRLYNHYKANNARPGTDELKEFWNKVVPLRKEVNTKIKNAKTEYIMQILNKSNSNANKFWKVIEEIIPRHSSTCLEGGFCQTNGKFCTEMEAANAINKFFLNVGSSLVKNLPPCVGGRRGQCSPDPREGTGDVSDHAANLLGY